jgi:isoleucyl-tRNA synthetase
MHNANQEENEILKYWDEHQCFEKSISSRPENKEYSFYDGPPFATGTPHYGHIVASLMKDIVPRYFTMRGFRVERRWGWDCHGLPVENIIERDLRLKNKKDIEKFGIDKFNEACRSTVMTYADVWKNTIKRMGRWVDMENDYKTMDLSFMESVWWVFNELWKRDLIYKGYKPMHICPRCETPLSNFEVTQEYKDIEDISVTVKFELLNLENSKLLADFVDHKIFVLAWTTTPWTLPGNVLLAVNDRLDYALVEIEGENGLFILGLEQIEKILKDKKYKILKEFLGRDLDGLVYEPLFPYFADTSGAFHITLADFVTVEDGTGVVHIAPAFGQDDFMIGEREKLPLIQHVSMDGRFIDRASDFAGLEVKPKENSMATDAKIINWLKENKKLFSQEKIRHSYPHCWRCETPLLNYSTSSWFVKVTDIKDGLIKNNKLINWVPEHMKEGRFGQWLEGARDWAISRNRFWGTPLPIWVSDDGDYICIGSVEELENLSGEKITDLHKHIVDTIVFEKDGKKYRRIPEVLDCWFESGSMPYAQMHYPFENKEKFERNFPAEFIAEGQDQTRGWFYTLHVLATALTRLPNPAIPAEHGEPAFKHCVVNGIVLAEDGKKMAKKLKNYPDPDVLLEKYGADALRYYLATSPVMEAENLNFSESGVKESYNKLINILWNVVEFYKLYADKNTEDELIEKPKNLLDRWILAKLNELVKTVTENMENYRLIAAGRPIQDFVTEFSQWYVRRSRDRFKIGDADDKKMALSVLRHTLLTLSKIMAPFTPFIAEKIYLELGGKEESVHLDLWPETQKELLNTAIIQEMAVARKIVEMGLSARAEKGVKVRQPLGQIIVTGVEDLTGELKIIIADELNVKELIADKILPTDNNWVAKQDGRVGVALNIEITDELKKEGMARELIRTINQLRKEQKLTVNDKVDLSFNTDSDEIKQAFSEFKEKIQISVVAESIIESSAENGVEFEIEGNKVIIQITKK